MIVAVLVVAALGIPSAATAYSVLAHEANIDALWDPTIKSLILARYSSATADEIAAARAYAYGGCVIQDLRYYPFGSQTFVRRSTG